MWKVIFELYRAFDIDLAKDKEWDTKGHWFVTPSNVEMYVRPKAQ